MDLIIYKKIIIRRQNSQESKFYAQYYTARFTDLKKRVENDYVLNKAEYLRTETAGQSLLLQMGR